MCGPPHSGIGIRSIFPRAPPSPTPSAKSRKQMTYASLFLRLPARSLSLKELYAKSREQGSYQQSRAYDRAILGPATPPLGSAEPAHRFRLSKILDYLLDNLYSIRLSEVGWGSQEQSVAEDCRRERLGRHALNGCLFHWQNEPFA